MVLYKEHVHALCHRLRHPPIIRYGLASRVRLSRWNTFIYSLPIEVHLARYSINIHQRFIIYLVLQRIFFELLLLKHLHKQ